MLECPICRQPFDGRFQVFVPSYPEGFDSIACARRAAGSGWPAAVPIPGMPTIEVVARQAEPQVTSAGSRWSVAALGAGVAPGQAALAGGVGLMAAGVAASAYIWASWPSSHTTPLAAGIPHTRQTATVPPPAAPPPTARPAPKAARPAAKRPARVVVTKPAALGPSEAAAPPTSGAAESPPPPPAPKPVRVGPKSAAEAQYGDYQPPFASVSR
jgi:hypothetical protein